MRVACVFLSHSPVAGELLDRPELCADGRAPGRGRPVVIGGAAERRKSVLDCSPEAAAQGVRPGMPLRQALALCPKATFLEPDPARYQDAFEAILRALEGISPLVEAADLLPKADPPLAGGRAPLGVGGPAGGHPHHITPPPA